MKGVLTQVQLGEADAGLVYVTDVLAARDVEGIDLPDDAQVAATYPAAVLADGAEPHRGVSLRRLPPRRRGPGASWLPSGFGRP